MMFEARVFITLFPDSTCWPAIAGAKVPDACLVFLERAGLKMARFVFHSPLSMTTLRLQARGCSPEIGESFAFFAKPPGIEGGVIFDPEVLADNHGMVRAFPEEAGKITAKKGPFLPSKVGSNERDDLMFSSFESSVVGCCVLADRH